MTYPAWKTLETELQAITGATTGLVDLFGFINATPSLVSFNRIAANLVEILPVCARIKKASPDSMLSKLPSEEVMLGWAQICKTINQNVDILSKSIQKLNHPSSDPSRPELPSKEKPLTRHGAYVLGWYSSPEEDNKKQFQLLQAMLITLDAKFRSLTNDPKEKFNLSYRAQHIFRDYLTQKDWIGLVEKLPSDVYSIEDYKHCLSKALQGDKLKPIRAAFHYGLQGILEGASYHQGHGRRTTSKKNRPSPPRQWGDWDEEPQEIIVIPPVDIEPNKTQDEEFKKGISRQQQPKRSEPKQIFFTGDGADPKEYGFSPRQKVLRSKRRIAAYAAGNQLLPTRWDLLSTHEMACLIKAIWDISQGLSDIVHPDISMPHLGAAMGAMIWYSIPLEKFSELSITFERESKSKKLGLIALPGLLVTEHSRRPKSKSRKTKNLFQDEEAPVKRVPSRSYSWVVQPASAKTSLPPTRDSIPVADHFRLPVPSLLAKIFESYLEEQSQITHDDSKLFPFKLKIYEEAVGRFLGRLQDQVHSQKLTARRISDLFFYKTQEIAGGDIAASMLLTGRWHFLGQSKIHYTSLTSDVLNQIYSSTCLELANDMCREIVYSCPNLEWKDLIVTPPAQPCANIGAKYRPQPNRLGDLVTRLKLSIQEQPARGLYHPDCISEQHNVLACYTLLMVSYATGLRPLREPGFRPWDVDSLSGTAKITDKEDEGHYNSRVVWLPPVCRDQLNIYYQHLRKLTDILPLINLPVAKDLRILTRWGTAQMPQVSPSDFLTIEPFFVFGGDLRKPKPLSPGFLQKTINDLGFDFKDNAHRSHLRSRLLERHCPVEVINALLGHWEWGQEYWGPHSGLSLGLFQEHLNDHIPEIMSELGWEPVHFKVKQDDIEPVPLGPDQADLFTF